MYRDQEENIIATVLDSPIAPGIVARLQSALEIEKQRRNKFYQDIDDDMKVEFINGEIIVHSPVKKEHTDTLGLLYKLVDTYVQIQDLGFVGYEKVMISLSRNDYEPDLVYFNKSKSKDFTKGQWKFPVPDFVVEILSDGTKERDRGIKFKDFEEHGVKEYWIINTDDECIEQYELIDGKYHLKLKSTDGHIRSVAIQGLSIHIRSIFDRDENLNELKKMVK